MVRICCLAAMLIFMFNMDAVAQCPTCPQDVRGSVTVLTTTTPPPAAYGSRGSGRSWSRSVTRSWGSTGGLSYGSVGGRSVRTRTVSRSFFDYGRGTSRYRQRWTVAGGNANIANHLSNAPHGFDVSGMSYDEMLMLHDSHHDRIGPVAMVGNTVAAVGTGVTFRVTNTVRRFRQGVRSRIRNFWMRRRGC